MNSFPEFISWILSRTKNQIPQLLRSNLPVSPHDGSFLYFHLPVKESPHSLSDHCSYIPSRIHVLLYHGSTSKSPISIFGSFLSIANLSLFSHREPTTSYVWVTWFILLTHNCDVMVSTVHSRTHKVRCAGIYTDVFFISMLLMNCLLLQDVRVAQA